MAILATKPEFLVAKDEMLVALVTDYRSQFRSCSEIRSVCLNVLLLLIVMHEYLPIRDTVSTFRATSNK